MVYRYQRGKGVNLIVRESKVGPSSLFHSVCVKFKVRVGLQRHSQPGLGDFQPRVMTELNAIHPC